MSNSQTSPLDESLFTFDYNSLQQEIESAINANYIDYIDDECFDGDGAFDGHDDVEMSDESGFDKEVPKEDKVEVTSCVIIDNDKNHEMIERCNRFDMNRSIYNLIGSFEVDSDVVKEVGDKVEKLGVCLKHLNYDQNTLHRPQIGESHFNETPSETTSLDSAVTTSSNNQMIPNPETSCLTDHIEQMLPEPLFVDNQFTNEWVEKFNNVFSTLCEENGKDFGVDKINDSIQEYIKSGCCLPPPNLVILDGGPEPNSNPNVHESCDMYLNDFERMLMLHDEFVDESVVSRSARAVNERRQAMWILVDELLKVFKDASPQNSILFKNTTQLTKNGYDLMFTCYEKGISRLDKIIKQDIDFTERRIAKGRRRHDINQLKTKDLGSSTYYVEEEEMQVEVVQVVEINLDQDGPNEMVIEPVLEQSSPMDINETNSVI
ncbi:7342_t:CDS:2 [Entrophospora sp. SA101]|nr:7342_t:CDS:2 [Entrophospora sp. SA101]